LRRSYPALSVGEYEPIAATGDLLAYLRRTQGERVLVALNLDAEPYSLSIDSFGADGQILLSTHMDRSDEMAMSSIALRPDEGVIISLSAVKGPRSS
jgi:alpha-glucosidase